MKKNQDNSGTLQPNQLAGQTSPYLLQHLYNPVNWYPWSEEALQKAVREDKPIIVSIGYSACHWCHVMEKESFEDTEVAEMMNRNFICIKVDREERPDIDHMYMTAVQLLTRQGGWPLNCFALPDTRPFWGGTYFTNNQWKSILMQVTELYKAKKNELTEQAEQLTDGIAASGFIETLTDEFSFNEGDAGLFFQNVMNFMDSRDGGTLHAPKFPLPVNLEFLLHYYYHTNDKTALSQVELSLEKMALGGIYDQIGGGFARYSTDEKWKVPHFEKMLYDNSQLLSVYSNVWKISKNPLFKQVVYQTIDFMSRELTSPHGTFYSALDADSEGEEGKFYIWTEDELDEVLGGNSHTVKTYYGVGGNGLWEKGWNILLRSLPDEDIALQFGVPIAELQSVIQSSNQLLLEARAKRIRPGLDNKVITSWNALAIKGLSDAYAAFGNDAFLDQAKITADFVIKYAMDSSGKVYRCLDGNKPSIEGFLEDYALLIQSLIRLYEVSMLPEYLLRAKILTEYVIQNFSSSGTSLFSFSSNQGKTLKAPFYELPDNVIPSSNSVMAVNLFYMANYFENREWAIQSTRMLNDMKSLILQQSINYSNWGRLLLHHVKPFYTLVISGPEAAENVKEIISRFIPGTIIAGSGSDNSAIPLLRSRFKPEQNWYYVCSQGNCKQPVKDLHSALDQMK